MKLGITGSKGFIGKNLVNHLKNRDIQFVELDTLNFDCYLDTQISHIIHLAGKTSVPNSWEMIPFFLDNNVVLTARVLDFALKIGAPVTLFSSYGYFDQSSILTPYHLTKAFTEQLANFYHQNFNLPITILRLASVYGVGQKMDHLFPLIVNQVLDPAIKEITVNSLNPKRSYIDVRDIIEFIILSLQKKTWGFHTYYVGDCKLYSVEDIIKKVLFIAGINKPYKQRDDNVDDSIVVNIQKNYSNISHLAWVPKYQLDDGIAHLLNCLKSYAQY